MARRGIAVAVAALVVAAGPAAARAEHYEPPAEMALRSCTEHVGSFLVPRAAMASYLAPGFTFGYFPADLAALDPGRRLATVIVITVRCAQRLVDQVPTAPEPDALAVVVVNPPAGLARPGAAFHAIGVRSAVDRGQVAYREPVVAASSTLGPLGALRSGLDSIRDGAVGMDLVTAAAGAVPAAAAGWRLFRTEDGQVLDAADVDASAATDTQPGAATLASRGIPGLPGVVAGFGIHEWGVDVDVRPVPLP